MSRRFSSSSSAIGVTGACARSQEVKGVQLRYPELRQAMAYKISRESRITIPGHLAHGSVD